MITWTGPALQAEIEYRHAEVRRRWRRRPRRDAARAAELVAPRPVVAVPAQRTAGPGERVPVGSGSGAGDRR